MLKAALAGLAMWVALCGTALAQRTRISGTVTDAATGQPLPFANVVFKGSHIGTITDSLGQYALETVRRFDSIQVSMMGYLGTALAVTQAVHQRMDVALEANPVMLGTVTVKPGENPAFRILRKVIANKPLNAPRHLSAYDYEAYHRVRFDLNNFTDKAKKNPFLKSFNYIWEGADTTQDGVTYLPLLMTESSERHYWRSNPPGRKEVIQGRKDYKFFTSPKLMEFIEDLYIDPDLYENYVTVLDKAFPSPVNDNYKANYSFLLLDSLVPVGGRSCYRIAFRPKTKADVAFTGEMLIDDSTYALVQADLSFSIEANINFVRSYWIRQQFGRVDGRQWFMLRSEVLGDFTVIENSKDMTGFFGRKVTQLRDFRLGSPMPDAFYSALAQIEMQDSASIRTDDFWQQVRTEPFTKDEDQLARMTARLANDPKWKALLSAMHLIFDSYQPAGPVDFGDVMTFYTWNTVEGHRPKIGFRTNDKFSRMARVSGYLAYGTDDRQWKGGGTFDLYFPEDTYGRRMAFGGIFRHDLAQQGRSDNAMQLDNIINSFIRISGTFKRMMHQHLSAYAERQWFAGLSTRVSVFRDEYSPREKGFFETVEGIRSPTAFHTAAGARLNVRFAWGQAELPASFRNTVPTLYAPRYPMLSFELVAAFPGMWGGSLAYRHYKLRLDHRLRARKWGYLNILAEGGVIDGQVPFPVLHVPDGNPMLLNDERAFNLMNYMEFAADRYVSLQLEHHFEGLLFNRIPGIRILKLREVVFAKGYYGTLTDANANGRFALADGMARMTHPYAEVGFGIENLLKISRIDFIWRLTHLGPPDVLPFIVKPSFYMRF